MYGQHFQQYKALRGATADIANVPIEVLRIQLAIFETLNITSQKISTFSYQLRVFDFFLG
jgi:hypothetical protein